MTRRAIATMVTAAAVLAAYSCGDDAGGSARTTAVRALTASTSATTQPPESSPANPCAEAFATAAAVSAMADSVEDLYPAASACASLAEWTSAAASHPGAVDTDPVEFAYNMCSRAPPAVANTTLCAEAIAADPLGVEALFPKD